MGSVQKHLSQRRIIEAWEGRVGRHGKRLDDHDAELKAMSEDICALRRDVQIADARTEAEVCRAHKHMAHIYALLAIVIAGLGALAFVVR